MLATLTGFTSINRKFKWTEVGQDAFENIRQIVACDTLSTYPGLNETFKIHTNYITFQIGSVIKQKGKLIVSYSIKLTDAQQRYKVI